ncbi:hypothetical protein WAI453_007716 [Rhynchosporium graminicola]
MSAMKYALIPRFEEYFQLLVCVAHFYPFFAVCSSRSTFCKRLEASAMASKTTTPQAREMMMQSNKALQKLPRQFFEVIKKMKGF